MEQVQLMERVAMRRARYAPGRQAYCKYCYTTHPHWERDTVDDAFFANGFPFELVWLCLRCHHRTRDDHMQVA